MDISSLMETPKWFHSIEEVEMKRRITLLFDTNDYSDVR
jgi:hypothetical protein